MPDDEVVPRKPDADRRSAYLRVRLTEDQLVMIKEAAKHAGITVSAWVQERLVRVARQERRRTAAESAGEE
jgi:uncharacterized protein (DUF1778 family)